MYTFLRYRTQYRAMHPGCAIRDCNTYALAMMYSTLRGRECERAFRLLCDVTRDRETASVAVWTYYGHN